MQRWIMVAALCALSGCQYYEVGHGDCEDDGWPEGWYGDGGDVDGAVWGHIDGEVGGDIDGGLPPFDPDSGSPGEACTDSSECRGDTVCLEGACTALDDACRARADCGPDRSCVDNACRPLCVDDSACAHGTGCVDGVCQPAIECASSRDCEPGHECVEARCLAGCLDDAECGSDAVCDAAGVCRPDVGPRPFCGDDSECASGHLCVEGVCRTPCPTEADEECQRWDTQLVLCAEPEPGLHLCYTRAEANPDCVTRLECGATEHCIDGLCR